jgi:GNAT superfamily N-acetyltransferase
MLTIEHVTMAQIQHAPNIDALMAEYEAESANPGIGPINPQWATYAMMETAGMLHAVAARVDGQLVGFMLLLLPVLPHFGQVAGISESYFVAAAHRHTGAGTKLRQAAEQIAREAGARGIMVSAPIDSNLARVMPRSGYRAASTVFFKGLQ